MAEGGPGLVPNGTTLKTYRLALAANVEYSDFHSTAVPPLKADVLNNGIIPTMNRVNGIYERDLAVRMVLVATEESIIFVTEPDATEPIATGLSTPVATAVLNTDGKTPATLPERS